MKRQKKKKNIKTQYDADTHLPIASDQCDSQPYEPSNDNDKFQSNNQFDKSRNKNNRKTTLPNKK